MHAHHLDTAAAATTSRPLGTLPGLKGALSVLPIPTAGVLVVATRASVKLFNWAGGAGPVPSPLSARSKAAPALKALPFTACGEHAIVGTIPASALASGRRRSGSVAGLRGSSSPGNLHVCVTRVAWTGSLLCVAVIHRADVVLHQPSADVDDDDEPPTTTLGDSSDAGDAAPSEADTGYVLSHLLLSLRGGALVRQVRCGPAPPLDAAGLPTSAASASAALARKDVSDVAGGGAGDSAPGTGTAGGIANVVELLGSGWVGSPPSDAKGAPVPPPALPPVSCWGAAAIVTEAVVVPPPPVRDESSRRRRRSERGYGAGVGSGGEDDEAAEEEDEDALRDGSGTDPTVAGLSHRSDSFDSLSSADGSGTHSAADDGGDSDTDAARSPGAATAGGRGAMLVVAVTTLPPDVPGSDSDGGPTHSPVAGLHIVGTSLRADGGGRLLQGGLFGGGGAQPPAGAAGAPSLGGGGAAALPPVPLGAYPLALHASAWFPYLLSVQGGTDGCVTVFNVETGRVAQRVKLPHACGLAVCPTEARVRMDVAAGRLPRLGTVTPRAGDADSGAAGDGEGHLPVGGAAALGDVVRGVLARPERVFAFSRSGVVQLGLQPLVMHVASLLSKRPPQFEASLSLAERGRALQTAQSQVLQAIAAPAGRSSGAKGVRDGDGGDDDGDDGIVHMDAATAGLRDPSEGGGDASAAAAVAVASRAAAPPPAADPIALVGVSDAKIRQIRAHFGYQLFARGTFGPALGHLAAAREPVRHVLALVPQLLPRGCRISVRYPLRMPVMIDALLPALLRPLIAFLLAARRRFRCDSGRAEVEDDDDAEERERGRQDAGDAETEGEADDDDGGDEEAAGEHGGGPDGAAGAGDHGFNDSRRVSFAGEAAPAASSGAARSSSGHTSSSAAASLLTAGLAHGSSFLSAASGGASSNHSTAGLGSSPDSDDASASAPHHRHPHGRHRLAMSDVLSSQARLDALSARLGGVHIAQASSSSSSSGSNSANAATPPTPVLIDTMLLTALLWVEAHLLAQHNAASLERVGGARRVAGPPQTRRMPAAARAELQRTRRTLSKLVSGPNCCDVREAELQLASFRGSPPGPELVALYRGRGLHAHAVGVLADEAQTALAAMRLLAATEAAEAPRAAREADGNDDTVAAAGTTLDSLPPAEDVLVLVAPKLAGLCAYLRQLGQPHEALVLPRLRPLLTGAAGGVGFLLGLAALCPPPAWLPPPAVAPAAHTPAPAGATPPTAGATNAITAPLLSVTPYDPVPATAAVVSSGAAMSTLAQTFTGASHALAPLDALEVAGFLRGLAFAAPAAQVPAVFDLGCDVRALSGGQPLPAALPAAEGLLDMFAPPGCVGRGRRGPRPNNSSERMARQAVIVYLEQQLLTRGGGGGGGMPEWGVNALLALYVDVLAESLALLTTTATTAATASLPRPSAASGGGDGAWDAAAEERVFDDYRRRFMALGSSAPRFDAAGLLAALPADDSQAAAAPSLSGRAGGAAADAAAAPPGQFSLFRERVLLLRRLGRHDDALRVLVQQVRDYAAADEYCDRVYTAATASSRLPGDAAGVSGSAAAASGGDLDVYIALLRAYVGAGASSAAAAPAGSSEGGAPRAAAAAGVLEPPSWRRPAAGGAGGGDGGAVARGPPPRMAEIPDDDAAVVPVDARERGARSGDSGSGGRGALAEHAHGSALLAALLFGSHVEGPAAAGGGGSGSSGASGDAHSTLPVSDSQAAGSQDHASTVATVMEIMTRNNSRVDPTRAMAMLPSSLPLASVAPFLTSSLRHSQDTQRTLAITRQLQQALHLRARTKLLARQTRRAVVERHTVCAVCRRKLAMVGAVGVFAMLPDGALVHVGCQPAQQAPAGAAGGERS